MIDQQGATQIADDRGKTITRMNQPWKGVTIYYTAQPSEENKELYFMDTPSGLIPFWMSEEEVNDVSHVYNTWKEIYTLQMKASGKEPDPKYLDLLE